MRTSSRGMLRDLRTDEVRAVVHIPPVRARILLAERGQRELDAWWDSQIPWPSRIFVLDDRDASLNGSRHSTDRAMSVGPDSRYAYITSPGRVSCGACPWTMPPR